MNLQTIAEAAVARIAAMPGATNATVDVEDAPDSTTYGTVGGLTGLACRVVDLSRAQNRDNFVWALEIGATHVLQIYAYLPAIEPLMRLRGKSGVAAGMIYQVLPMGAQHPSHAYTNLAVQGSEAPA
jgi:hypothetical protein